MDQYNSNMMEKLVEPLLSLVEDWDEDAAQNVGACKTAMCDFLKELIDPADEAIMEQAEDLIQMLSQKDN